MKKIYRVAYVALLAVELTAGLGACGSSGSDSDPAPKTAPTSTIASTTASTTTASTTTIVETLTAKIDAELAELDRLLTNMDNEITEA